MTKQDIQSLYPDVYNEIFQEGMNSCGEEHARRNEARNAEQYEEWIRNQSAPEEEESFTCNICNCTFDNFTTGDVHEHIERCTPDKICY